GRLYRWLVAGSVLELLIAVPSYVVVNRRHDCAAPFVSSFGVATGLAMLLMSIGPGALFLFRARMRRMALPAARAGGAVMSPVALPGHRCGAARQLLSSEHGCGAGQDIRAPPASAGQR